jgi:hypothetical protein
LLASAVNLKKKKKGSKNSVHAQTLGGGLNPEGRVASDLVVPIM